MSSRVLRIINVSIAVVALLLLVIVYWFAWRPLPVTSGELTLGIAGNATIARDKLGVPHIESRTWQDAIFLQGYVTAQDRLWQMDSLRRFSGGQLAEIAGASAVPVDELARRLQIRSIAEAQAQSLSGDDRIAIVQFTRGVNEFINTHLDNLPVEFRLPGHAYSPRPWTPVDSMLVGLILTRSLTESYQSDFRKAQLLALAAAKSPANASKIQTLFPARGGWAERPGSNSWAVSGAHTATGKPILASDPHLNISIPSIWHMIHLKAPGLNVDGVTVPGLPGVIIGHNEHVAWGVTNLQGDYQDLYQEQLDPRTGQYVFQGKLEQARLQRDFIAVQGAKPTVVDTWVTRHGAVVQTIGRASFSLRWTANDSKGYPFFDIDRAQNWQQFREALSRYPGPPQTFTYADNSGNIGYQCAGNIPIRRNYVGDVPVDGSSGQYEWEGYVPFEKLPSRYNPPSGIVATANQDPFPDDFAYPVPGAFADKYRIRQIHSRLDAKQKLTVADMLVIQKDVYSAYHVFLAKQIAAAVQRKQAGSEDMNILSGWNGQMDKDLPAPFATEVFHLEAGKSLVQSAVARVPSEAIPRPQVIETLLRTRPAGWVDNNDWDGWIVARWKQALEEGRKRQGGRLESWKWGNVLNWTIAHPIGKQIPFVDRFFNLGPFPMSGASTSVKQTKPLNGPSMRMVVDFGNLDHSVQNLPTGESGMVASAHYKDQWNAYYNGASFPMQFNKVEAAGILRVRPKK